MSQVSERPAWVPFGYCWCGCGERTAIADRTRSDKTGWVKGQPLRWAVAGHANRRWWRVTVEDRGHASPCHIWQGATCRGGYGSVRAHGRRRATHTLAWEIVNGLVPDGLMLDHLCRVPACCNPDHLEPVTNAENTRRGAKAILTKQDANAIRRDTRSSAEVAADFGVHPTTITNIRARRRWATDMEGTA